MSTVTLSFGEMRDYTIDHLEGTTIQVMTYPMPNVNGQMIDATAMVFYPEREQPKDGWRIVAWTHGTLGVAQKCAPSLNPLGKNFKSVAEVLLQAGYVIVAPDYEGLGSAGIHPYLDLKSEAMSTIYAVESIQKILPNDFQGDWMVVGQSQGGQAAIGTAEYANDDPHFKGTVAGAPASHLDRIILEIAPQALTNFNAKEAMNGIPLMDRQSIHAYSTLLAYGALVAAGLKANHPDFDSLALFQEHSRDIAQKASGDHGYDGVCLNPLRTLFKEDVVQYLQDHPDAALTTYPGLNTQVFQDNEVLQNFFKISQPGTKKLDKPLLVIQGAIDMQVPAVITQALVKHLKDLGSNNVRMILVDNASHSEAIVWQRDELLAFIESLMPAQ